MKKHLLFAAAALMTVSSAMAETRYFQAGDPITDISQMKENDHADLYFIQMYLPNRGKSGFLYSQNKNLQHQFTVAYNNETAIDENGSSSIARVFRISFVEGTDNFTIQSLNSNHYFSIQGNNGYGKHNAWATVDGSGVVTGTNRPLTIANFTLTDVTYVPTDATQIQNAANDALKDSRWVVKSTNAYFDNNEANGSFHWFSNDGGAGGWLTYHKSPNDQGTAQVAFIPVKAVESRTATITFPQWNGEDMVKEVEVFDGKDVSPYIRAMIQEFGGMQNPVIKSNSSDESDMIVSADNASFTVEGDWNDDFAPYQVYRLAIRPSGDSSIAIRYMFSLDEIRTRQGTHESLSRLIPERLWYFVPGEEPNTYTMHNLYDTSKGVYFENANNATKATYSENPTPLELIHHNTKDCFLLRVHGTENSYLNEFQYSVYGNETTIRIWQDARAATDDGSVFRLYALEDADMVALGLDADAQPMANDEKFLQAVVDYNAQNIAAALRRVEYWGGESIFGPQPGKLDNENGDFLEKLAYAKEIAAKGAAATQEELEQAVAGIGFDTVDFNEITPGYYRIKNKKSGLYISTYSDVTSEYSSQTRYHMALVSKEEAERSNTVFYFDKNADGSWNIVSFDTGLVFPRFGRDDLDWIPVLATDDQAGKYNIAHQHLAGCILHTSYEGQAHRHLYGGADVTPSKGVNVSGEEYTDKLQWYVERVDKLPIPLYNDENSTEAWASVYSPVPLRIEDGEAIVNIGKFTGTQVWRQVHDTGDIVPANTPALLDYKGGADNSSLRGGISYIYVTPIYNQATEAVYYDGAEEEETTTPAVETKALNGGIYAIAKEEGTHYYTLHDTEHNNFRQYSKEDPKEDYIPGFKAHIAVPATETPAEAFAIVNDPSTGVEEITAEEPAKAAKVYDLQGRRLAAPAKGINIINGQKVLVK